jgi:hypothetical protein
VERKVKNSSTAHIVGQGPNNACICLRASIIASWEPAESDVEEREEKREKKVGALLVAG